MQEALRILDRVYMRFKNNFLVITRRWRFSHKANRKSRHPEIELSNVAFLQFASGKRMEIGYQIFNTNDDPIKITTTNTAWNISEPHLLRDWETYQDKKLSKKFNKTLAKGQAHTAKVICDVLAPLHVHVVKNHIANVFVFGDVYYEIISSGDKYRHSFVIIVRLNRSFDYIEKSTIKV